MAIQWTTRLIMAAAVVIFTSVFLRVLWILPSTHPTKPHRRKRGTPTRLLVVLGSGGHTAEMFRLLHGIHPSSYTHRSYVTSEGDEFSALKAHEYEKELAVKHPAKRSLMNQDFRANYDISTIPRARKIHQSLLTTPVSVFRCLWACFAILPSFNLRGTSPPGGTRYPDLILTNGPGTAVCVVLASVILRFFAVRETHGKMRTIYVESWARVKRLSLSGRILVGVVDRFLVQWEGLKGVGGRAEYIGVLVS